MSTRNALQLVELVGRRWRVTPGELLSGIALTEQTLSDPHAQIPLKTMIQLVERARKLTGEPGLGVYVGLERRISVYGYIGFAAMWASTLREALKISIRYLPALTSAFSYHLYVQGKAASLTIEEHADFGSARDYFLTAIIASLWHVGCALTGRELGGSADIATPEPPYFGRFAHLVPPVRFDQPQNRVLFDSSTLDLPILAADPVAMRLELENCERELEAQRRESSFVESIRQHIMMVDGGYRSVEEVSAKAAVSPRTLHRKLAAHGTSFSALLEAEQRENALLLLRSSDRSIDDVSRRVGYARVQNFTRAFKRWTGMTPAAYRRACKRSS